MALEVVRGEELDLGGRMLAEAEQVHRAVFLAEQPRDQLAAEIAGGQVIRIADRDQRLRRPVAVLDLAAAEGEGALAAVVERAL